MRTFYSLPNNYSSQVQEEIHQLIHHNDGGYSWYHVYNHMPVQYRKFHLRKTQETLEEKRKQMEDDGSGSSAPVSGKTPKSVEDVAGDVDVPEDFEKPDVDVPQDPPKPSSKTSNGSSESSSDFEIPDDIPKSGSFDELSETEKPSNPDVNIPSPDND